MSHTTSPSMTLSASEKSSKEKDSKVCTAESDETNPHVNTDIAATDASMKDRILKEVGVTSTAFIGPAFPPQKNTAKSKIEDSLSEFYKELDKCDTPDGANGNTGKHDEGVAPPVVPPIKPSRKDTVPKEKIVDPANSVETDGNQTNSGRKKTWPHWHQNEPYYPRRQRPGSEVDSDRTLSHQDQWNSPQPQNKPPNSTCYRPAFPHQPPPPAFSDPQDLPSRVNASLNSSGVTNQFQGTRPFLPSSGFPRPNVPSHSSLEFDRNDPHQKDHQFSMHVSNSDNTPSWCYGDGDKEKFHFGEYNNQTYKFDEHADVWERDPQYESCDDTPSHPPAPVLILMRGLPGSGKSTRARELLSTGDNGVILSTDDYFAYKNNYRYDSSLIGAAHEWNQHRAREALYDGCSPVIIDNTNLQAWEMKPYVKMALGKGYKVDFCEPETSWKFNPHELEKRNKHGVPQEKIAQMLDRFSFPVSVDIVMSSQEPPHVIHRGRREEPGAPKN